MYFFLSIIMLDIPTACSNDKVLSAQSRCQFLKAFQSAHYFSDGFALWSVVGSNDLSDENMNSNLML